MRVLALLSLFAALPVSAQSPCVGGTASGDGLAFSCSGIDLVDRLTPTELGNASCGSQCLLDVWGWTDPDTGREYALAGLTVGGVAAVEVTPPGRPRRLGRIVWPGDPETSAQDIKVYRHWLYASTHTHAQSLIAFDLRRLRGLSEDASRTLLADTETAAGLSAHNLAVNHAAGRLFASGSSVCNGSGGLRAFSLDDPAVPVELGCSPTFSHDAQCLRYDGPDAEHAGKDVCFNFSGASVEILDMANLAAPAILGEGVYPNASFVHQGWLTDDRRHLLVDDEFDENEGANNTRTLVFEVSDLDAPEFVGAYLNPSTTDHDHNQYVRGRYVYQANYSAGLRILDLDRIATANLQEVAFFDTFPGDVSYVFDGAWSVYPFFESGRVVVTDQANGLFVLRPDPAVVLVADEVRPEAPAGLALIAETPATGEAAVRLTAPAGERVRLTAYDLLGRELSVLFDGVATGSVQTFAVGAGLPAGVVLLRAETAEGVLTRRVTLVR